MRRVVSMIGHRPVSENMVLDPASMTVETPVESQASRTVSEGDF